MAWFASVPACAAIPSENAGWQARVCWSADLGMVAELMAADDGAVTDASITDRADLLVELMVTPG